MKIQDKELALEKKGFSGARIVLMVLIHFLSCLAFSSSLSAEELFFTFQVETLSNKNASDAMVNELKQKGYPAYVAVLKTQKKMLLYKVRIGEYKTRAEAEKAASDFQSREKKPWFIVRSKGNTLLPVMRKKSGSKFAIQAKPARDGVLKKELPEKTGKKNSDKEGTPANRTDEKQAASSETFYTIQVSTELDANVAESSVKRLEQKGFPAYVLKKKTEKGKMLYKVRIGKYKTRLEAKKESLIYHSTEKKSYLIVKSNADTWQFVTRKQDEKNSLNDKLWPGNVTKIFAYRGHDGDLNLTNSFKKIPEKLRAKIEYISVFPVRFISPGKKKTLIIDVENRQRNIKIAGIEFSSKTFSDCALDYFEQKLKDVPLRLKYGPVSTKKGGSTFGRLYTRQGVCINLEMIRQGIGRCSLETIDPDQREPFKAAEDIAKKEKAGIWGK